MTHERYSCCRQCAICSPADRRIRWPQVGYSQIWSLRISSKVNTHQNNLKFSFIYLFIAYPNLICSIIGNNNVPYILLYSCHELIYWQKLIPLWLIVIFCNPFIISLRIEYWWNENKWWLFHYDITYWFIPLRCLI